VKKRADHKGANGGQTACLGLIRGLKMSLVPKKVDDSSEWVIIIGAAGAVGSFAVQVRISSS
jgi:NADPH:quinone reductase-like Zn-dependent oxidoreductase